MYAALMTLMNERLEPRVYFATDLYDTIYPQILFSNMRVEHFLFEKRKRFWILREHIPELHPRFAAAGEQMVI